MNTRSRLADFNHPIVRQTAERLTAGQTATRDRLERLFLYVRDGIKFGLPKDGDLVKASDTIRLGYGQCNTKGTLLLALCKAVGIPARIHFSLISKDIQKGLFAGMAYRLMPDLISHSWIEVEVDGKWRRLDSYINDESFFTAAKTKIEELGWDTGYSVSGRGETSSAAFDLEEGSFVQMGAVTGDHGVWDDPADYYASGEYRNRPGVLRLLVYRLLVGGINKKVETMRNSCPTTLCGIEDQPSSPAGTSRTPNVAQRLKGHQGVRGGQT